MAKMTFADFASKAQATPPADDPVVATVEESVDDTVPGPPPAETPLPLSAPAQREETALAVPTQPQHSSVDGEVTASDIALPRLRIVQGTSQNPNGFALGALTLNDEVALTDPKGADGKPSSILVVPLKVIKRLQEDVPFNSGITPKVFETEQEVLDAGGHFTWGKAGYYKKVSHNNLLIALDESQVESYSAAEQNLLDMYLPFSFEDKRFGFAISTTAGMAFTACGKQFLTAAFTFLPNLAEGFFRITPATKTTSGGNNVWVPRTQFVARLSPELRDFVASISGSVS